MTTPIYDQLASEAPDLICPICGRPELRGLHGDSDGDLAVCVECWIRGLHLPEIRAERACVDCGKYCFGLDACVLVTGDDVIPLCVNDFQKRMARR